MTTILAKDKEALTRLRELLERQISRFREYGSQYYTPSEAKDLRDLLIDVSDALSTPPVGGLDHEVVARIIRAEFAERYHHRATVSEWSMRAAIRICALATPQWLPIPLTVDTSKAPFERKNGERYLVWHRNCPDPMVRTWDEGGGGLARGFWDRSGFRIDEADVIGIAPVPLPRGSQ